MKVLLAGASGVIGRAMLPLLEAAGHVTVGVTRTKEEAQSLLSKEGILVSELLVIDALDRLAITDVVARIRPDVVVSQLTALTPDSREFTMDQALVRTAHLRIEGTRNLVIAAQEHGVKRFVAQSLAFAYTPSGVSIVDEFCPLYLRAPDPWGLTCQSVATLEGLVTGTPGFEGLVLRYGNLYGPSTAYSPEGSVATRIRERKMAIVEGGLGRWSFLHVVDAASAAVLAISNGPSGVYNIVDDDPAEHGEWLSCFAAAIGADTPLRIRPEQAKEELDWYSAFRAIDCPGASNRRARELLGWFPSRDSWRHSLGNITDEVDGVGRTSSSHECS